MGKKSRLSTARDFCVSDNELPAGKRTPPGASMVQLDRLHGNDGGALEFGARSRAYRDRVIRTSSLLLLGTVGRGTDEGASVCNGSLTLP